MAAVCGQTVATFGHWVGAITCGHSVTVIGQDVWTRGQLVGCCGKMVGPQSVFTGQTVITCEQVVCTELH